MQALKQQTIRSAPAPAPLMGSAAPGSAITSHAIITGRNKLLAVDLSEHEAERALCREISNGQDAYLMDMACLAPKKIAAFRAATAKAKF